MYSALLFVLPSYALLTACVFPLSLPLSLTMMFPPGFRVLLETVSECMCQALECDTRVSDTVVIRSVMFTQLSTSDL